jgi:hypothetical protein
MSTNLYEYVVLFTMIMIYKNKLLLEILGTRRMHEADAKQAANKPSTSLSLEVHSIIHNLPKLQPLGLLDLARRLTSLAVEIHDGVRLKEGG